jgi:acetyl-CoA C-acetyltransferase
VTADPWRTPVVLGVGQLVDRSASSDPLDLVRQATELALADAPGAAAAVTGLWVVGLLAGGGRAPARTVADELRLEPATLATTTIGGNTPQWLVSQAADRIAAGQPETIVICGGEALASLRRGQMPRQRRETGADAVIGDPRPGLSAIEQATGLALPAQVYPLIESAIARRLGRRLIDHRRALGELLAPLSEVAAHHEIAWRRQLLRPEEISGVDPAGRNQLLSQAYTKSMHACLYVDQAAAIVVSSLGQAQALGLADQAVFVHAAADATDVWFPSARPDPGRSPGIAAAAAAALDAAEIGAEDLALMDLYSCFPCALEMAAEALDVSVADPRVAGVTGGLPFFGGPGNNYTTHAIATMVGRLRDAPEATLGLVTGLGWYVTKHSVGIYGNRPPVRDYRRGDTAEAQRAIDATAVPVVTGLPGSPATVLAATVLYDHGDPVSAPAFLRLADGRHAVGCLDAAELHQVGDTNLVGARVHASGTPPTYTVVELAEGEG